MVCTPKGGHPTLEVGGIETPDVECSVARIDVDLLASWFQTLSDVHERQRNHTDTVRLIWQPVREKSDHERALQGQMHKIEPQNRKG